jgi:hypothetical protein
VKLDEAMDRAVFETVRDAVSNTADGVVSGAVYQALVWDVDVAVDEALYRTVALTLYWAARGDRQHNALVDFLSRAGAETP